MFQSSSLNIHIILNYIKQFSSPLNKLKRTKKTKKRLKHKIRPKQSNHFKKWFYCFLNRSSHYKISYFYRRTTSVGVWLEVRRWFFYRRHHRRITSVGFPFVGDSPFRRYIGRKNKKTICWWFYKRNLRTKKKDSRLKYTDGFLFRRWYCNWPTETIRR